MKDELLEAVDKAAEALLQRATSEASLADVSLAERVKAFEAVAKWAQFRGGPPPKRTEKEGAKGGSGRFGRLQHRFNGVSATPGRRGSGAPEAEAGGDEAAED